MPISVVLDREELRHAADIGVQRFERAKLLGKKARFDPSKSPDAHIQGAWGELAFATALGLEWPAHVDTFRTQPDVFPFWEVRWSSNPSKNKAAKDDQPHLLVAHVTGRPPGFEIWGYINAGWCQRNIPLTDPNNRGWAAHFFTTYQLSPIDDGFHSTCSWVNSYGGHEGWECIHCGKTMEDPER